MQTKYKLECLFLGHKYAYANVCDRCGFTIKEQLYIWFDDLKYDKELKEYKDNTFKIFLYTKNHKYTIITIPHYDGSPPYMGAQVICRKYREGEDWLRGNDLSDGKFSKDLWNKIIQDIIKYEKH